MMNPQDEKYARENFVPSFKRMSTHFLGYVVSLVCDELRRREVLSVNDSNNVIHIMLSAKIDADRKGEK